MLEITPPEYLLAAESRLRFPLNLGDCFAYAAAIVRGLPLLAVASDFGSTDVTLVL